MDGILTGLILIAVVSYLTYKAYCVLIKKEIRCCFGEDYQHIHEQPRNGYNRGNRAEINQEDGETPCGDTRGEPRR